MNWSRNYWWLSISGCRSADTWVRKESSCKTRIACRTFAWQLLLVIYGIDKFIIIVRIGYGNYGRRKERFVMLGISAVLVASLLREIMLLLCTDLIMKLRERGESREAYNADAFMASNLRGASYFFEDVVISIMMVPPVPPCSSHGNSRLQNLAFQKCPGSPGTKVNNIWALKCKANKCKLYLSQSARVF